ncbi:MAG: STAS/SEC14 domain-containing protein [Boseongicola sp.]|nr:STAS/SEC14 domain-containing protein [Boseongicola sp.]NNJ68225.1 STAS/SEC14 domain-containing protein [Boseongicola sp.]
MFTLDCDAGGFVRLTIGGKIDEAQMKDGLEEFLKIVEAADKTDFLYTIENFEFPALQAIAVEMGYIPRLISSLPKIGKVAVVADQAWLRKAADIEGMLIPGLTIQTFPPDGEDDAKAWLTA